MFVVFIILIIVVVILVVLVVGPAAGPGRPERPFRDGPEMVQNGPGLARAPKWIQTDNFLKEINKKTSPSRNSEIRPSEPVDLALVIFRFLLYVCGETAILLLPKVLCVYLSYALFGTNFVPKITFSFEMQRL